MDIVFHYNKMHDYTNQFNIIW